MFLSFWTLLRQSFAFYPIPASHLQSCCRSLRSAGVRDRKDAILARGHFRFVFNLGVRPAFHMTAFPSDQMRELGAGLWGEAQPCSTQLFHSRAVCRVISSSVGQCFWLAWSQSIMWDSTPQPFLRPTRSVLSTCLFLHTRLLVRFW